MKRHRAPSCSYCDVCLSQLTFLFAKMDNSTILAWIFTTLLLVVGVMLYRNTHSHDKKSVSRDYAGVRRKVLVVANDVGTVATKQRVDPLHAVGSGMRRVPAEYRNSHFPYQEI